MSDLTRIVAFADSLAMPRNENGAILLWEETWPYLLEKSLVAEGLGAEVINCGARARTSTMLLGEFTEHVVLKRPDVVIIEVGVVDCLPRVFSRREKRVMNLPGFPARIRNQLIARRRGSTCGRIWRRSRRRCGPRRWRIRTRVEQVACRRTRWRTP